MVWLPTPLRAALGLAVTVADEARRFPDRAVELPMLAVSTALQMSLRAQQRYAALTARGDAVLSARHVGDEPPEWARFDDDPGALDDDVELAATVADLVDQVDTGPGTLTVVADTEDEPSSALTAEPDQPSGPGLFDADLTQPAADGLGEAEAAPDVVDATLADATLAQAALADAALADAALADATLADATDVGSADVDAATAQAPARRPRAPRKRSDKTVRAPRNARPSRFDVVSDE